jgi:hypothetical protein
VSVFYGAEEHGENLRGLKDLDGGRREEDENQKSEISDSTNLRERGRN